MGLEELNFQKLPVMPQVAANILQLDDNSDFSFKELGKLIQADQSISAIILRAANSPFYSRGQNIKTLQPAIALLGFKIVKSMIILSSSKSIFKDGKYEKFRKYVWRHSIVSAILAKAIARRTKNRKIEEEAFVGALLHDIGKVMLNSHDRSAFINTLNTAVEKNIPVYEAEKMYFGFTHHEAGKKAVEVWKLPEIYAVITSEHEKDNWEELNYEENTLLLIVSFSNYLAKKIGYGHHTNSDEKGFLSLCKVLNISDEDLEYYLEEFPRELEKDEFFKFCSALV